MKRSPKAAAVKTEKAAPVMPDANAPAAAVAEAEKQAEAKAPAEDSDPDDDAEDQVVSLARTSAVREWVKAQRELAEGTLRFGPHGEGWKFNASKRDDAENLAEFLRLLSNSINLANSL